MKNREAEKALSRYLSGECSEAEVAELLAWVAEDPGNADCFAQACLLDDMARELFEEGRIAATRPQRGRGMILAGVAAAVAVLLLSLGLLTQERPIGSSYAAVNLPGAEEVAVVSSVKEVDWVGETDLAPGSRLKPGSLHLASGEMELVFLCGATVHLEGPAEFQLLSRDHAVLTKGKAAAQVPEEAFGFTIKTPDAAVVDLGTEFALSVDDEGESLVHVYDGEVHVSLLGEDGSTHSSSSIYGGNSLEWSLDKQFLNASEKSPDSLPRVEKRDDRFLEVSEEYRDLVMESAPLVYWDFKGGKTNNLMGPHYEGVLGGDALPSNDALSFDGNGFIMSSESIPDLNKEYTLSLWVKPSKVQYATISAIGRVSSNGRHLKHHHLLELVHETHVMHKPISVRLLHRSNEGEEVSEQNLFSDEAYLPSKWVHLVAVTKPGSLELYLNGALTRRMEKAYEQSEEDHLLVLGRIGHLRDLRPFQGLLDEFALYNRALTAEEIQKQFEAMASSNPEQLSLETP
ncbi:MAG: FecR domain-containing protein [Verrucomicrobiales bacterium]|nr:FecR domain-containing protein [Verrucomicrobiales bacterium]